MNKAKKIIGIILSLVLSLALLFTLVACEKHEHEFDEWHCVSPEGTPCEQREYEQNCECGEKKTRSGAYDDHDFEVETVEPNCTEGGYDLGTCTICGKTEKSNNTPVKHELDSEYLFDSQSHWRACKNCDYTSEPKNHNLGVSGSCTVCGQQINSTEGLILELSEDGEYYIVRSYTGRAQDVVIAGIYNNKPIKEIGAGAFFQQTGLTRVEMNSVTIVGSNAFYNCTSLSSVEMNSVTEIKSMAFAFCTSLTSIEFPNALESIGSNVFYNCTSLSRIIMGDVASIEGYMFEGCENLTTVVLGAVGNIDSHAFGGCENLTTVEIDEVANIAAYAFKDCENLTNLVLGPVGNIEACAFYDCTSLDSVFIKGSIRDWGYVETAGNDALMNATYYEYSETEPTEVGNYWHYDENGEIAVWDKEQPPVDAEIYIASGDMPNRLIFVLGQELDLSGGFLSVVKDGSIERIPLNNSNITVSGYDKNQLGRQILIVWYAGKNTTFEVTVVKRLEISFVNNTELKFFQGMEFVVPNGEVTVTYDNGRQDKFSLSSSLIVISIPESFSETVGKKTVAISFQAYTGEFEIEVVEVADVMFYAPSRRYYESHETQIDMTGGFLLYRDAKAVSGQAGGLEKYVYLTQDMVKEGTFNPADATYEDNYKGIDGNADLIQDVTIVYSGREFHMNIVIEFSDVSLVKHYADVLKDIDWIENGFNCTDEQIDMAEEAAELYFGFSDEEQSLINPNSLKPIMTIAAYYAYNFCYEGFQRYADIIALSYDATWGIVVDVVVDTYTDAKASIVRFQEDDYAELKEYNALLSKILSDGVFAEFEYDYGVTIVDYCEFAVSQSKIDYAVGSIEFAANLYDTLEGVTIDDVADFSTVTEGVKTKLETSLDTINASKYREDRSVFATVEMWRPGFFDILYQYYYNVAVDNMKADPTANKYNNNFGLNALLNIGCGAYLPEPLEAFYTNAVELFKKFVGDNHLDASPFYYYYDKMQKAADSISSSKELYKDLFSVMQFITPYHIIDNKIYDPVFAEQILLDAELICLNYYKAGGYDYEEYESLIAEYLPLVELYLNGAYIEPDYGLVDYVLTEDFCESVPKFFESFLAYSSGVQTLYLTNICTVEGVFDVDEPNNSILSLFLELYYSQALDEDTYAVFGDLLVSFESFLRRASSKVYTIDKFLSKYQSAKNAYNKLSLDQQAQISFLYKHVESLIGLVDNRTLKFKDIVISDSSWNSRFDDMAKLIGDYYFVYFVTSGYGAFAMQIEFEAKVDLAYAELLADINAVEDEELRALLHKALQFKQYNLLESYQSTYKSSIQDCYLNLLRPSSMNLIASGMIFNNTVNLLPYWNDEMIQKIASFSELSLDMFRILLGYSSKSEILGREDVDAMFKSFLSSDGSWTLEQKVVYSELHRISESFLGNLFDYAFWGYYSDKTGIPQAATKDDAIISFITLVERYNSYAYSLTDTKAANSYQSALKNFNTAYERLTDAQKAAFNGEFGAFVATYTTAPKA